MSAQHTPGQVASIFGALKRGRDAQYVGGGWIMVRNLNTPSCTTYRVRVTEARAAIAKATGSTS